MPCARRTSIFLVSSIVKMIFETTSLVLIPVESYTKLEFNYIKIYSGKKNPKNSLFLSSLPISIPESGMFLKRDHED